MRGVVEPSAPDDGPGPVGDLRAGPERDILENQRWSAATP